MKSYYFIVRNFRGRKLIPLPFSIQVLKVPVKCKKAKRTKTIKNKQLIKIPIQNDKEDDFAIDAVIPITFISNDDVINIFHLMWILQNN